MIYAGIDAGSRAIKIVLLDGETLEIAGWGTADQGIGSDELASDLLDDLLSRLQYDRSDLAGVVATGY
ncbi:MAG TPA: 2-hydroxyglutaryl-CoA dehydratase, partial [Armatimonadota bacterium]